MTPNRLRLGRNNNRCPVGPTVITNDPKKVLDATQRIFDAWWQNWADVVVPGLMERPKGEFGDRNLEQGDLVMMKRQEGDLAGVYKYGMVEELEVGADGVVRKVVVRYRNIGESVDRTTRRSVNGLVLIRRRDEIDTWELLSEAAKIADIKLLLSKK